MRTAQRLWFVLFLLLLCAAPLYAETDGEEARLVERMAELVCQIAVILFAAKLGGHLFSKAGFPSVLGQLVAGLAVGPYLLGALPLPGFPRGLFPFHGDFPVSPELFSFATIASIVLLFLVGLETDIELFRRFSVAGSAIGIGGVVVSFLAGDLVAVWFSRHVFGVQYGFADPIPLFLGVVSTATSVGVSACILTEKRKMGSPEGVTILSAAIIDDVLGIVLLAVVLGVAKSGRLQWAQAARIALKAVLIWLGFMALGLAFSRRIGDALKHFRDKNSIAVMGFSLALLLSGVFEKSGLAMIIGAYVMGLTLSKTDLAYLIRDRLAILYRFFVPLFFCVMGMLVDVGGMLSAGVLLFATVYCLTAVLGKMLGCSLPALFLDFNRRGALRIGMGMVPRGEVALIIAGIGLSSGILKQDAFSAAVLMTFATTLVPPLIFSRMLDEPGGVLRSGRPIRAKREHIVYRMPNPETAELVLAKVIAAFRNEGFFISLVDIPSQLYQLRKEDTFITMRSSAKDITFDCRGRDVPFVYTLIYEVLAELERVMRQLQTLRGRESIGRHIFDKPAGPKPAGNHREKTQVAGLLHPESVECDLKGRDKREVVEELLGLLCRSGQLGGDRCGAALEDILEREKDISTGMQDGIAFPHTRTDVVDRLICAVGLKRGGVEFGSIDGKPSRIFVMSLIPSGEPKPYLQLLAVLSQFLAKEENRERVLACDTNRELYEIFRTLL